MPSAVVELIDVCKCFSSSRLILSELTFKGHAGQIIGIVGKSGCGKSTILNMIAGFEQPSAGNIYVSGTLGYATQRDLLLPWRNTLANILLPLEIKGNLQDEGVRRARQLLKIVGLDNAEHLFPSELSGGMRQKVALVRTLIHDAQILLLDEPFSAMDCDVRLTLIKELRNLLLSSSKLVFFVTHNIEEAVSFCDVVFVLGLSPARIIHRAEISIKEKLRDPVAVRKTPEFPRLFQGIWEAISRE